MWGRCPWGVSQLASWLLMMYQFDMRKQRKKVMDETGHPWPHTKVSQKFAKQNTDFRENVWYCTFGQVHSSLPPRYHHMPYVLHSLVSSTNTLQLVHNTSWDVGRPKKDNTSNQHVLGALSLHLLSNKLTILFPLQFLSSQMYQGLIRTRKTTSHSSPIAALSLQQLLTVQWCLWHVAEVVCESTVAWSYARANASWRMAITKRGARLLGNVVGPQQTRVLLGRRGTLKDFIVHHGRLVELNLKYYFLGMRHILS